MAAGANMDLVFRVDVVTEIGDEMSLTLPVDCDALEAEILRIGAVLFSSDPLMSMIKSDLDTYKDRDVRQALEPLVRVANRTGISVLGNAHFNKSTGNDPLSLIMGSAAFGNVVRAALGFARDPEAENGSCVISQVKNNLGRLDLPSLRYVIEEATIDTEEGPAVVGKLMMLGESSRSVSDILNDHGSKSDDDKHRDIDLWLEALLRAGPMESNDIYRSADGAGFTKDQAKGAKKRLGIIATHPVIPGPWFWELPQGSTQESQGSGVSETSPLGPLGTPLDESSTCTSCGEPLHPSLVGDGETTHPNCATD